MIDDKNASKWQKAISDFKRESKTFINVYGLMEKEKIPDFLKPEYNALMMRGRKIKSSIIKLTSTVNNVIGRLKDFFGLSGYSVDYNENNGMGVLPLIPVAVIVGAIALIIKWTTDARKLGSKLDKIKRLQNDEGISFKEASEIVSKLSEDKPMFGFDFGGYVPLVAVVGVVGFLYYNARK